jgi:hypothetical protein
MIDLKAIQKTPVSAPVAAFMAANGGSHVALYKGWEQNPMMKLDRSLVEQQLAYILLQGKNHALALRLVGRLRRIDNARENRMLAEMFGVKEDTTVAPLADLGVLG